MRMNKKRRTKLLADVKCGDRKPTMPASKQFKDRKREAKKYVCRKNGDCV